MMSVAWPSSRGPITTSDHAADRQHASRRRGAAARARGSSRAGGPSRRIARCARPARRRRRPARTARAAPGGRWWRESYCSEASPLRLAVVVPSSLMRPPPACWEATISAYVAQVCEQCRRGCRHRPLGRPRARGSGRRGGSTTRAGRRSRPRHGRCAAPAPPAGARRWRGRAPRTRRRTRRCSGRTTSARAIASRWRWPPDTLVPPCVIALSMPSASPARSRPPGRSRARPRARPRWRPAAEAEVGGDRAGEQVRAAAARSRPCPTAVPAPRSRTSTPFDEHRALGGVDQARR